MRKKATVRAISTGPKTKAGKKVASMNATKHGLTAKNFLNEQEKELYQSLLDSFTGEYKAQTPTEHLLIQRIANTTTKLNRCQTVEDNLFERAREKAGDYINVINSFELDNKSASDAILTKLGLLNPSEDTNYDLLRELITLKDPDKVTGYDYVLKHLPEIRKEIFRDCKKESIDIVDLIGGLANPSQIRIRYVSTYVGSDGQLAPIPEKTDEELDQSGHKVSAEDIVAYIRKKLDIFKRKTRSAEAVLGFDRRKQLLINSAMPDPNEMDRLMRYQTSLNRQLSKELGELLVVIDRRKKQT